jgi:hypothetical protein
LIFFLALPQSFGGSASRSFDLTADLFASVIAGADLSPTFVSILGHPNIKIAINLYA